MQNLFLIDTVFGAVVCGLSRGQGPRTFPHKWCRERSQQNLFLIDAVLGAVGCGLSRVGAEGKALGFPPSPRGGGKVGIS